MSGRNVTIFAAGLVLGLLLGAVLGPGRYEVAFMGGALVRADQLTGRTWVLLPEAGGWYSLPEKKRLGEITEELITVAEEMANWWQKWRSSEDVPETGGSIFHQLSESAPEEGVPETGDIGRIEGGQDPDSALEWLRGKGESKEAPAPPEKPLSAVEQLRGEKPAPAEP